MVPIWVIRYARSTHFLAQTKTNQIQGKNIESWLDEFRELISPMVCGCAVPMYEEHHGVPLDTGEGGRTLDCCSAGAQARMYHTALTNYLSSCLSKVNYVPLIRPIIPTWDRQGTLSRFARNSSNGKLHGFCVPSRSYLTLVRPFLSTSYSSSWNNNIWMFHQRFILSNINAQRSSFTPFTLYVVVSYYIPESSLHSLAPCIGSATYFRHSPDPKSLLIYQY